MSPHFEHSLLRSIAAHINPKKKKEREKQEEKLYYKQNMFHVAVPCLLIVAKLSARVCTAF